MERVDGEKGTMKPLRRNLEREGTQWKWAFKASILEGDTLCRDLATKIRSKVIEW